VTAHLGSRALQGKVRRGFKQEGEWLGEGERRGGGAWDRAGHWHAACCSPRPRFLRFICSRR
jgi:hypothetical protein